VSVKLHRQAEALMGEADILTANGQLEEARARWLDAAHLEAEVFAQIPKDRGKTRGIIAVSTVELFRRAGALDEAIRTAHAYLKSGGLPDAWQTELKALSDEAELKRQALSRSSATPEVNGHADHDVCPRYRVDASDDSPRLAARDKARETEPEPGGCQ